jgi:hypothetical protein
VLDEHVAAGDRTEHVGLLVALGRAERCRCHGHVRRVLEVGPVDGAEREEAAEVEWPREHVDLVVGDVELGHEQFERHVVHVVGHLEADGRAEASPQELLLEGLQEVLGLVLLDRHVLVAREAERVVIEDLHAGEDVAQVLGDEVFEQDEASLAVVGLQRVEPRKHGRHLEAGELLLLTARVVDAHGDVEGEARDVGERVHRVDGERHQHGEDLLVEEVAELDALGIGELVPADDVDALVGELWAHAVVEDRRVPLLQLVGLGADGVEGHLRRDASGGRDGEAGRDTALEAGDAHHEELVEVRGEDREEVRPLEERRRGVLAELEHTLVEGEPAELAVDEAASRHVRRVCTGLGGAEFDCHAVILAGVRRRTVPRCACPAGSR